MKLAKNIAVLNNKKEAYFEDISIQDTFVVKGSYYEFILMKISPREYITLCTLSAPDHLNSSILQYCTSIFFEKPLQDVNRYQLCDTQSNKEN